MMKQPYYRTATLDNIARNVLKIYNRQYLNLEPQAVPLENIIEDNFNLGIEYMRLTITGNELGRMIYDDGYTIRFNPEINDYELVAVSAGTVLIESLLVNDPKAYGRYRFTLAHELGHWLLHKKLYTDTSFASSHAENARKKDSIEWQANYIAKSILMPMGQVKRGFHNLEGTFKNKIITLAGIFEVSKQAMEIRLNELGLN